MHRAHNFSAGPAALPLSVIEQLQAALPEFAGTGLGLMEMSHRSAAFQSVMDSARARLKALLGVPSDYEVLYLQGGASLQFYMVPLNLLGASEGADFVITGAWTSKALKEARRCSNSQAAWDGKPLAYKHIPQAGEYTVRDEATFVAYTTNNTIYGTQWHHLPDVGEHHLVADMSSDICSRPADIARHDVVFAGAQKNLGPSGVTAVILSPWALERSRTAGGSRPGGLPSMLDFGLMVDQGSMYNTPNTFGVFALDRMLAWLEDLGGLDAMARINTEKADFLYGELDRTDYWRPHAETGSRSQMNVTWRIANPDLEPVFAREADVAGLKGLKGHRSVGGLRASLYNACTVDDVRALVAFMQDFERRNG